MPGHKPGTHGYALEASAKAPPPALAEALREQVDLTTTLRQALDEARQALDEAHQAILHIKDCRLCQEQGGPCGGASEAVRRGHARALDRLFLREDPLTVLHRKGGCVGTYTDDDKVSCPTCLRDLARQAGAAAERADLWPVVEAAIAVAQTGLAQPEILPRMMTIRRQVEDLLVKRPEYRLVLLAEGE